MTTYYAKAMEVLNKKIYDVNPAKYTGLLSTMGQLEDIEVKDPVNVPVVHYNAIENKVNTVISQTPQYADGDFILHPGVTEPVWATWSIRVKESDMISINADPKGQLAQQVQQNIIAQQGYYVNIVDRFAANYLATANPAAANDNYIASWVGAFGAQAATGTVLKPEDCNASAGSITANGTKITGAGGAVDSVTKGFEAIKDRWGSFVDTTTFQRLTHPDGNNVSTLYINPETLEKIKDKKIVPASGEVSTIKVGDELNQLFRVVPTYAFDAAYDCAAATVSEYGLGLNTEENFKWQQVVPYYVSDWEYFPNSAKPLSGVFRKYGTMRFIAFPVAHKINGSWKKAFQHFSNIPYATS